jgi:glycosyltransferase involved in cell wall biosynthesis
MTSLEKMPLVSILTPSFNQARWLPDNLASVASQTYPDIEHVVMDGGSTDGSVKLLESTTGSVLWRSEPDAGQSAALNKAFAASSGEIIGWLNSDDAYFSTSAVESVVAYFEGHPDVDVVYGHSAYVNADGLVLHMMWTPSFSRWWFRRYDFISQPTVFLRRRAIEEAFLDETFHFAMDYELWLRLAENGRPFHRIDEVLAMDRLQPERKSAVMDDVLRADIDRLRERYGIVGVHPGNRPMVALRGLWSRFAGIRLIRAALQPDLAFAARPTTYGDLLRRQIAARRSRMPVGGD